MIVFGVSLQNCEGRQKRMGTFEKRLRKFDNLLVIGDDLYTRDIRGEINDYQEIMKPENENNDYQEIRKLANENNDYQEMMKPANEKRTNCRLDDKCNHFLQHFCFRMPCRKRAREFGCFSTFKSRLS